MLKIGDRFIVIKEYYNWTRNGYALKGDTGTIKEIILEWCQYAVKWDKEVSGDLVNFDMVELLERPKKVIKPFGIVKWCKENYV